MAAMVPRRTLCRSCCTAARAASGSWPLLPLLRVLGADARPFVAILHFLQSLVELTDEKNGHEEPPTPEENIDALIEPAPKKDSSRKTTASSSSPWSSSATSWFAR